MPADPDPLARRAAVAIGAARVALGIGAVFFTEPALRSMGFGEGGATGRALAKLAGGRDIALGLLTVTAGDRETLRRMTLTGAALDAADALSSGLAARDPATRPGSFGGVASGTAAAIASLWAGRRL